MKLMHKARKGTHGMNAATGAKAYYAGAAKFMKRQAAKARRREDRRAVGE